MIRAQRFLINQETWEDIVGAPILIQTLELWTPHQSGFISTFLESGNLFWAYKSIRNGLEVCIARYDGESFEFPTSYPLFLSGRWNGAWSNKTTNPILAESSFRTGVRSIIKQTSAMDWGAFNYLPYWRDTIEEAYGLWVSASIILS